MDEREKKQEETVAETSSMPQPEVVTEQEETPQPEVVAGQAETSQSETVAEQIEIPQPEVVTEQTETLQSKIIQQPQVVAGTEDNPRKLGRNSRREKVLELEREAKRQSELEETRTKRIHQEQEYIDKMIVSVEASMKSSAEGRRYNAEFEEKIRRQVYQMHGISEDKLTGMERYRAAYYQGAAFALFFLSVVLVVLCGVLHGFRSEVTLFMAFFTAIEGTLLTNGKKESAPLEVIIRVLYLLLFPSMLVIFVCYELGFPEYELLCPVFTVVGLIVLLLGAVSYFLYDPYRQDRRDRRKAESYLKDMERAASKEVQLKEKAEEKLRKKQERQARKEEKKRQKLNKN